MASLKKLVEEHKLNKARCGSKLPILQI